MSAAQLPDLVLSCLYGSTINTHWTKDGDRYPLMQYLSESEPASDAEPAITACSPTPSDSWPAPVEAQQRSRIVSILPEVIPEWWSDAWMKLGTHMIQEGTTMPVRKGMNGETLTWFNFSRGLSLF
jgi:hypothetical protein